MYIDIEFVVHFLNGPNYVQANFNLKVNCVDTKWKKESCAVTFQFLNPYYNFSDKLLVHDLTQYLKKNILIGLGHGYI